MRSGCKRIVNGILWIKVKLGEEVALGPGHIVLDGDPALLTPKGSTPPTILAHVLWPLYTEAGDGDGSSSESDCPNPF